jgi:hypothetical protein
MNFIVCSVVTRGYGLHVPIFRGQFNLSLEVVNSSQVNKNEKYCKARYDQDLLVFLFKDFRTLLAIVVDE